METAQADTVIINPGDSLSLEIVYDVDLTGATVGLATVSGIVQAYPTVFQMAEITVINAATGTLRMTMSKVGVEQLRMGRLNWFRLEVTFPDGTNDITPKIWVELE